METYEFTVEGMSCGGCEDRVTNAVETIEGVRRVTADNESGRVAVTATADVEDDVERAIHDAGFDVAA